MEDNTVFVGKKNTMSYVFSVQEQSINFKEIHIKARGRSISQAVDVCQVSIHRFLTGWEIKEVNISTELREREDKAMDRVSVIDIVINKVG